LRSSTCKKSPTRRSWMPIVCVCLREWVRVRERSSSRTSEDERTRERTMEERERAWERDLRKAAVYSSPAAPHYQAFQAILLLSYSLRRWWAPAETQQKRQKGTRLKTGKNRERVSCIGGKIRVVIEVLKSNQRYGPTEKEDETHTGQRNSHRGFRPTILDISVFLFTSSTCQNTTNEQHLSSSRWHVTQR